MADDLCDAHDRHIFRADYALEAGIDHARSTHSHESRGLANRAQLPFEFLDEQCTVVLAAGFAGRDEDRGGLGHSCAALSRAGNNHNGFACHEKTGKSDRSVIEF
jgi:hypothetical protein